MDAPAPTSRRTAACVAALLALSAALALWAARAKSETYDEPMYVLSAYSYVSTGDFSLNREHPPLAKLLIGLPLLTLPLELPADHQARPGMATAFLSHQPRADVRTILFRARLPGIALLLVLGLYVWRWARLAFGETAGLAALALAVLNPNLIGHAAVATNDLPVTVFGFACCYHAWRWLTTEHRASLLLAAVMLGCAVGCKLVALALLPVLAAVVLGVALARRRPALLLHGALAGFAALGVLWLLYAGEARSLAEARVHPRFAAREEGGAIFAALPIEGALRAVFGADGKIPLLSFLKGLDLQLGHAERGHRQFFHGVASKEGSPWFYAATWLIKNPEAFTLLLLLGFLAWRRTWRGAAHEALLLLYPLVLFVVFSRADVQLGFKYVLPIVPFLAVAASRWLAAPAGSSPSAPRGEALAAAVLIQLVSLAVQLGLGDKGPARWSHAVPWLAALAVSAWLVLAARRAGFHGRVRLLGPALLLLLWASGASLARQPHDLVYFNEWVGGPENGTRWSVLGDDWGQDTRLLGEWMAEHGVERVRYDYYGTGEPEAWGVRSSPTFADPDAFEPFTGFCAVHLAILRRWPDSYAFLAGKRPEEVLGHTIHIYELTDQDRNDMLLRQATRPSAPPLDER